MPKTFLEECGIMTDVIISVKEKSIIISATNKKEKKKWQDFKKTKLKVSTLKNRFDDTDWTW